MEDQMEDVCEKVCVFEESFDIDFDYEFDVAMYFDFLRPETVDEIQESELWFHSSGGHPPSPLLLKLGLVTEETGGSDAYYISDDGGESDILSRDQGKKGTELKSKSTNQSALSKTSRLLQPTASLLAKQNQLVSVRGTKPPGRIPKLGSPILSPGVIAATKRQKLEHGYLRKVAHLKHQTNFSHKPPKKVVSSNVSSGHAKPKVTVPKGPSLGTADRAQRHKSNNAPELRRDSKQDSCSVKERPSTTKTSERKLTRTQSLASASQGAGVHNTKGTTPNGRLLDTKRSKSFNAAMHQEADKMKAHPLVKKKLSSKGDIGALQNSKRETTAQKDFKRTNSKKDLETPPTELFSQLSLNSENQMRSAVEVDQSLQKKGLKKNTQGSMKENKNATTVIGKSTRCCLKQNQIGRGRMTVIGNQPINARTLAIH
ncbi:hypothetical protein RND81_12G120000 [Saponaria officinalis]|uniref:TPX2 central domain-containing protein n=1 Tax=Saponaria officinalis TaxID=3572 RepID=A0AAW1H9K1_SAPOF